jgi:MoaA/NifB/PqqE/SkfB family radical SAM enzyme
MYLDQHGFVRACCMNEGHVLGNVTAGSLVDIWRGGPAGRLRQAMADNDLSLGCDFCKWPIENDRSDLAFSRWFADLPVEPEPAWPTQIEFSVSNTCNLQCTMCNGEWSSSIRSQREGLPPLPKVYDDAFFEDLRAFVPHLRRVKFLGGEPFLAAETLRIMDMLVDAGSTATCHVTTNGTQWSPRVERILAMLPVDIAVSLDATTPATYDRIRVGSDWEAVRANLDRFRSTARRRGTHVSITMCLMTLNWHEFADFCLLADRLDVSCDVNTVTQPTPLSLYHLPADELAVVVEGLEELDRRHGDAFGWSRGTWKGELDRLQRHLVDRRAGVPVMGIDLNQGEQVTIRPWDRGDEMRADAELVAAREAAVLRRQAAVGDGAALVMLDLDDRVVPGAGPVLGVEPSALTGKLGSELFEVFSARLSPITEIHNGPWVGEDRTLDVRLADGRRIVVFTTPALEHDHRVGTEIHLAWADG